MQHFDAVVLGLGGIGSSALASIADRGTRVLGVDRFEPPHAMGSSHGGSRVIRLAYFEHEGYVPLLREAFEAFDRLARDAGVALIQRVGLLQGGIANNEIVSGTIRAARTHDLRVDAMSGAEATRKFNAFDLPAAWELVYEHDAGFIRPEETIRVQLERARNAGAEIRTNTEVTHWINHNNGVRVHFADGSTLDTSTLVVCGGAWAPKLLAHDESLRAFNLTPTQQTIVWLGAGAKSAIASALSTNAMPVWLFDDGEGGAPYGVPAFEGMGAPRGLKIGIHQHGGSAVDPASMARSVSDAAAESVRQRVGQFVKVAREAEVVASASCLYTESMDGHFIVDSLSPESPNVIVATACNGHAFKFVPVLGRLLADAVADRASLQSGPAAFLTRGVRSPLQR